MAGNVTESTMKFKVDISDLKSNMKAAQREIKVANSEFKAATASMDDWSTSADGLTAKITQQQKVLNAQKGILNSLKAQYKQVVEEQGANSKAAQDLEIKINNQKATVIKAQKELGKFEDALDELEKGFDDAGNSASDASKDLKDASKAADDAGDSADDAGDGFTVLKGSLASLIADGIRGFISGIGDAIEQTKEFRKEMSLLKEVADENEVAFEKTKEAYKKLLATRGDEGAVTETLNNLLTAGFNEENLDAITSGVEGLAIRFKDTLSQEGIADSIQEWLGSGGENLTGNFAEALERMGYNLEDVKAKTKGMTDEQRQQWVITTLQKEGLNELSASYRENNKDAIAASDAQFRFTDAMSTIATKAEPVFTAVKNGFARILEEVGKLIEKMNTEEFVKAVEKAFNFLIDNGPTIISILAGIAAGFAALMIGNAILSLTATFKTLFTAIKAGDSIMKALNITMKANPFVLVASLVAALVAALVVLWNTNEDFRNSCIKVWNNVKSAISTACTAIVNFFKVTIPNGLKSMLSWFTNAYNSVKAWGSNVVSSARNAALNLVAAVVNGVSSLPDKMLNIGKDLVKGLWNGINNMTSWVKSKIKGFSNSVLEGIKNFFGVHSPSRETAWIGEMLGEGLGSGIVDSIKSAVSSAKQMASEVLNTLHGELDEINIDPNLKGNVRSSIKSLNGGSGSLTGTSRGIASQTVNFNQTINSPKSIDRLTLYRQTNSLVFSAKERLKHA